MDKDLQAANDLIKECLDKAKAIEAKAAAEKRDLTDEESEQIVKLGADTETARKARDEIKAKIEKQNAAKAQLKSGEDALNETMPRRIMSPAGNTSVIDMESSKAWTIPAEARRHTPKHFKGPNASERAYRFGMFCLAAMGRPKASRWCAEHGIGLDSAENGFTDVQGAGHTSTGLGTGSVFVPDEFDNELLILREQYGIFRQHAKIRPMNSGTLSYNRRTGGLAAYFVAEQAAGTVSTTTNDQIQLTSRDLFVFSTMTNNLSEDAVINFGDSLASEIAYAFANKEDLCGFIGTGTSTYGGIIGVTQKLLGLSATRANIAGLVVASGNLFSEIVLSDFNKVVGKLPQYADNPNTAWFMHRTFFYEVCDRLTDAAGGTTKNELQGGGRPMFKGYPVVFSQVMPNVDANDQVACLLGDLRLAADFGDRKGTAIAFSQDATVDSRSMFMTNETAIRGHERFDIVVHDVGNQSATAASRVPGPVVGLLMAAS